MGKTLLPIVISRWALVHLLAPATLMPVIVLSSVGLPHGKSISLSPHMLGLVVDGVSHIHLVQEGTISSCLSSCRWSNVLPHSYASLELAHTAVING